MQGQPTTKSRITFKKRIKANIAFLTERSDESLLQELNAIILLYIAFYEVERNGLRVVKVFRVCLVLLFLRDPTQ